ncbi:hypothetical protein D3C80_2113700 [compost metagenome]
MNLACIRGNYTHLRILQNGQVRSLESDDAGIGGRVLADNDHFLVYAALLNLYFPDR